MDGRYDPQLVNDEVQKLILLTRNMTIDNNGIRITFGNNVLALQSDGNMVIYNSVGTPLWYTGT